MDHAPAAPTLIEAVMRYLRGRIAARRLGPGARLPSIRALARERGVSNATVIEAYERLVAQGLVTARPGSGFFVAGRVPPMLPGPPPDRERAVDPLWIMRQSLEAGESVPRPGCGWLPDAWMPADALRAGLRRAARLDARPLVAYADPLGHPPLREHLAARLTERGIPARADGLMLTDSATQAIDLVLRLLLRPGDRVLVDDPCYFNFLGLLKAHGAEAIGVPTTPSGPDLAAFERAAAAHRPRLYLTNAGFQNPTGASLSPVVAHRLLRLAETYDVRIVEDDIMADLEPEPAAPRLAALDGLERVIHLASFSKTLSAAVRTGFVAARPDRIEALTDLKLAASFGHSDLSAGLVYGLLTDGSYRRHVAGLRARLARALPPVARSLERNGLSLWHEPRGGPFLWAELPEGLDSGRVAQAAMRRGVVLAPGNAFSAGGRAGHYLRFNVARGLPPEVEAVLAAAMDEVATAARSGPASVSA